MGLSVGFKPWNAAHILLIAMTYFRQISLQNDSVSSSSDASLYVDLSLDTGFNTISDRRVTSSSETSENLANQLRESPWVTSTTTEENIYTAHNQSSRTNLVKNNNNNNNMTNTTSNNADMCLFKVSYLLQGGK